MGEAMKQTPAQVLLAIHLLELGIATTAEYRFCSRQWRFDLVALDRRWAFECNGHWQGRHGTGWSEGFEKLNLAQAQGWRVFVFHNRQVETGKAKEWIKEHLL